jgi:hypothetical protein
MTRFAYRLAAEIVAVALVPIAGSHGRDAGNQFSRM